MSPYASYALTFELTKRLFKNFGDLNNKIIPTKMFTPGTRMRASHQLLISVSRILGRTTKNKMYIEMGMAIAHHLTVSGAMMPL
jgi:hypothetical protein